MRKRIALLLVLLSQVCNLLAQVTIVAASIPANTPPGDSIYIAGTFNDWDPAASSYVLNETVNGHPAITLNVSGLIKYKFTRGSWQKVEGDLSGGEIADRQVVAAAGQTVNVDILSWKDIAVTGGSALPTVSVLSGNFAMPQLNRSRRIWICLPTDYGTQPVKHYRVVYMHDGQNLFNSSLAFGGQEWGIDETMRDLMLQGDPGAIIIGIENGLGRLDEYSPWVNTEYNEGGEGAQYVDFIRNTLKPYIDSNYRTLADPANTGIAGSSMGGIISMYAAVKYPETFGKAGIFSPAFWFCKDDLIAFIANHPDAAIRSYFVSGTTESQSMVPNMNAVKNQLLSGGIADSNLRVITRADGAHSEWFWRREFKDAYTYLFPEWQDGPLKLKPIVENYQPTVYPNPFTTSVSLDLMPEHKYVVRLLDLTGRILVEKKVEGGFQTLNPGTAETGVYILTVTDDLGRKSVSRLMKTH